MFPRVCSSVPTPAWLPRGGDARLVWRGALPRLLQLRGRRQRRLLVLLLVLVVLLELSKKLVSVELCLHTIPTATGTTQLTT